MRITILLASILCLAVMVWTAVAQDGLKKVSATLRGYSEVPALSTTGTGEFKATIDPLDTQLTYELQYSGLTAPVTQAHIHLGVRSTNGGIMIWLCGTASNPGPTGTPVCPQEGTVTRTVFASDVVGPAGQGLSAGEFAEALQAIRSEVTYANVHSTSFTGGEIRGQIRPGHGSPPDDLR